MAIQDKITINLLPIELTLSKKERDRRNLINRLSIGGLILVIFIAAAVLIVRIGQTVKLQNLTSEIDNSKNSVQGYKEREGLLTILKTRLDGINSVAQLDPVQSQAFNVVISMIPDDIDIIEFKADKGGLVTLSGQTTNLFSLKSFFNNLVDPKVNQGKVSTVKIDSLSQRGDQVRFDLSMQVNGTKR